jgi:hypothetical protein
MARSARLTPLQDQMAGFQVIGTAACDAAQGWDRTYARRGVAAVAEADMSGTARARRSDHHNRGEMSR